MLDLCCSLHLEFLPLCRFSIYSVSSQLENQVLFLFFFFFSFRYYFFSFFSFLHWKLNYFDNFLTLFFHPRPRVCFFSLLLAFSLSFSFFFSISLSLSVRVWLLTCLARASFNWILLTRLSKRAEYTFSSPLFAIWADSFDRAVLSMPSTSSSCCFLSCWLLLLPLGDKESNQKTFQIKCIDSAHTHTHSDIYLSLQYLFILMCVCVYVSKRGGWGVRDVTFDLQQAIRIGNSKKTHWGCLLVFCFLFCVFILIFFDYFILLGLYTLVLSLSLVTNLGSYWIPCRSASLSTLPSQSLYRQDPTASAARPRTGCSSLGPIFFPNRGERNRSTNWHSQVDFSFLPLFLSFISAFAPLFPNLKRKKEQEKEKYLLTVILTHTHTHSVRCVLAVVCLRVDRRGLLVFVIWVTTLAMFTRRTAIGRRQAHLQGHRL